ncbi:MAG: hypothetical protein ACOYM3_12840 [Terrimicrobiaceae bacterium]
METNWFMQGGDSIFTISLATAVLAGVLISLIMNFSAGPHREPFWLAGVISAGSGATITTVVYVFHKASGLSIWQVMVLGAGCGALGILGYSLITTRREKTGSALRNSGGQFREEKQNAREPWRTPRIGCRMNLPSPNFPQKQITTARGQDAAQQ